ncbi:MAG: pirin family protein [Deltaproteobacteria bacterium]|nr:pirin family protein [Deltaproteobacteria bacterium]
MGKTRKIRSVLKSRPTIEGAGVRLKRAFGFDELPELDPFLLFDHFGSDNPDDYMAGFPWHPHRGIETVTYMIEGSVEHGDSIGNQGIINSGDIQWMTAGGGIIHQEMPQRHRGLMMGFQLWVNLPASHKMMNPRYRDIKKDQVPEILLDNGAKIRIISGEVGGVRGVVQDIVVDIQYLDIELEQFAELLHPVRDGHKVFAYIFEGSGSFDPEGSKQIGEGHLVVFQDGDSVKISAGAEGVRFFIVSGEPLGEPVAWQGPIVMNTQKELEIAFQEYRTGTFIKG